MISSTKTPTLLLALAAMGCDNTVPEDTPRDAGDSTTETDDTGVEADRPGLRHSRPGWRLIGPREPEVVVSAHLWSPVIRHGESLRGDAPPAELKVWSLVPVDDPNVVCRQQAPCAGFP